MGRAVARTCLALLAAGCGDSGPRAMPTSVPIETRFATTRLCALVPARDPAEGRLPQSPPIRAFGTDLGWTYERDGVLTIVFGDTWQRIDFCPLQINDDSIATMEVPAADWPGFTADTSLPDTKCPALTFVLDDAGTAFAPITLRRWDGVAVPLGPLNTPVTAFHDGEREWSIFIVAGGQACTASEAAAGAPCPGTLSAQAADLVCGTVNGQARCVDPTSTKRDAGAQAYYLHVAERVGPAAYISRALFLTNKYLNLTARAVRAFDPADARGRDYAPGAGALLIWGRPGFDDQNHEGEAPPYFAYHPLPFELAGDRIVFDPRYFEGTDGGLPRFGTDQAAAVPLYGGEFEPVNHAAVSWIAPLERWLMIYGGSSTDLLDPDGTSGLTQPVPGALHTRLASDPWGPWTDPAPILSEEMVAQDMVCGNRAPAGCLPPPDPPIRPACIELVDPQGGGNLYGVNVIDPLTRPVPPEQPGARAADVFWNLSTWHPYSVVLVRTRIELE